MRTRLPPEADAIKAAIARCHNARNKDYADYGGRGIAVCDQWRGRGGRAAFMAHIGPKPTRHHVLDRIDNNRGYEPGNVRWVTWTEQNNNRRSSHMVTVDGAAMTAAQLAAKLGIPRQQVTNRLKRGWAIEEIAATPVIPRLVGKPSSAPR